jgi:uncharacterized protein YdeI (BOF family)
MRYLPTPTQIRRTALKALSPALVVTALAATGSVWAGDSNPYLKPDGSWITISGSVESVQADQFTLDYGDGIIIVEMDDGDRDADGYKLLEGDKVTVSGRIDDDFFELTTIEAGSVYVENLGTTFFASSLDEESRGLFEANLFPPVDIAHTVVRGTVSEVNAHDFVLDTENRTLRVDVSEMTFDPLDDEGYLKIDEGDRVKVFGEMDANLFQGRELEADTIIELSKS